MDRKGEEEVCCWPALEKVIKEGEAEEASRWEQRKEA